MDLCLYCLLAHLSTRQLKTFQIVRIHMLYSGHASAHYGNHESDCRTTLCLIVHPLRCCGSNVSMHTFSHLTLIGELLLYIP